MGVQSQGIPPGWERVRTTWLHVTGPVLGAVVCAAQCKCCGLLLPHRHPAGCCMPHSLGSDLSLVATPGPQMSLAPLEHLQVPW